MAISPLLVWDSFGTPQAFRLLNGATLESTQLGDPTGFTAATLDGTAGRLPHNRIIEFKGDLYLNHRGTMYKFSFGGTANEWVSTGFTLPTAPTVDEQAMSSFHIMDVNGIATLLGVYNLHSSINCRGFWTTDGITWNTTSNFNNSASWPLFTIPFQDKLFVAGNASNNEVWSWVPATDTFEIFDIGLVSSVGRNGQLINFQGRLIWLGTDLSGGAQRPYFMKEFAAGGFIDVTFSGGTDAGVLTGGTVDGPTAGSCGMFEDAGNLYAVIWEMRNSTTLGNMRIHEFVPNLDTSGSFQENNVSSSTIPTDWLAGGAFENNGSLTANVNVHVDTSIPETPEVYWWRYDDHLAGTSTFWKWNGNSSLANVSSSVSRDISIVSGTDVSGEFVFTEGDFDVTIDNAVTRPGKIDFDVQVHEPIDGSSPGAKLGVLYYSVGDSDWLRAAFSTDIGDAPSLISGGGTEPDPTIVVDTAGTTLTDVPTNGSKYKLTWDSNADGFTTAGLRFKLMLKIIPQFMI